jgi:cytoskeletal protein CcmA (bactofilin family)
MGGKAALIVVIGFAFILGMLTLDMSRFSHRAIGNMAKYNSMTMSHNLALAGANARMAQLYQDTSDLGCMSQTLSAGGLQGTVNVTIASAGMNRLRLRSVSSIPVTMFSSVHDTVEVYFNTQRKNSFTLFAWMTNFEGNVFWISGDTVWGRVHSNGNLHINGSPVFMQKLTTAKNLDPPKVGSGTNKAIFKDGYETGVAEVVFPTDLSELVTAAVSGGRLYAGDVYVTLSPGSGANNDGWAYVRAGNVKTGAIIDSIDLNSGSFNGVLRASGKVNVEGTLDGKLTICSATSVVVQNDLYYERNPRFTPSSDDLLGLVAEQNVIVADNSANNSGCDIFGNIFTRTGSFTAENYSSRPIATLNVLGSIVQDTRGAVGQFAGSTLKNGFSKRYRFDDRLNDPAIRPPYYPGYYVRTFAVANWWESYRIMDFD